MKSIINMQVKDYIRNWSNQEINTEYADVKVYINIENTIVINQDAVNYALDSINDWIIYRNDLEEECITQHYRMAQLNKKMGIDVI